MKNFNIVLVDDELMIAEMTKEMLSDLGYQVLAVAKNYQEAMDTFAKHDDIDLAILDVNFNSEKDGIELAHEIEKIYSFPFIFLTSYSDPKTIKKASATTPSAYLLKPFTQDDLFSTIELIRARRKNTYNFILLKDGIRKVKVPLKDVHYIKSDNNYLDVITTNKKHVVRNSLDKFLEELNMSDIIRIHRSYAVNIHKVQAIQGQHLLLNGSKLPISRTYKNEFKNLFSQIAN